jgi:hypothetical protein
MRELQKFLDERIRRYDYGATLSLYVLKWSITDLRWRIEIDDLFVYTAQYTADISVE